METIKTIAKINDVEIKMISDDENRVALKHLCDAIGVNYSVITSYSIHYTKLYEFDSDNNTFKENTYDVINDINKNNNTMVPQPYLFHVIVKLIEKLDYELVGDFKRDDRIKKLLIYNNYPLDKFYSSGYPGLNIFNGFFNLNQIVVITSYSIHYTKLYESNFNS